MHLLAPTRDKKTEIISLNFSEILTVADGATRGIEQLGDVTRQLEKTIREQKAGFRQNI